MEVMKTKPDDTTDLENIIKQVREMDSDTDMKEVIDYAEKKVEEGKKVASAGMLMAAVDKALRQRALDEKDKVKNCWQCGKPLTTWDHPVAVFSYCISKQIMALRIDGSEAPVQFPSKMGGISYICHQCYSEGKDWVEGQNEETRRIITAVAEKERAVQIQSIETFDELHPEPSHHITSTTSNGDLDAQRNKTVDQNRPPT